MATIAETFGTAGEVVGINLAVDEIALEGRLRYCPMSNEILGLCREHIESYETQFNSIEDADRIIAGLKEGKLHLAAEVSDLCTAQHEMCLLTAPQATISAFCAFSSYPNRC